MLGPGPSRECALFSLCCTHDPATAPQFTLSLHCNLGFNRGCHHTTDSMSATAPIRLSHLCVEVLQAITSYLSAGDSSRLWLSGDKLFMVKLSHGGVKSFRLSADDTSRGLWPSLVISFPEITDIRLGLKDSRRLSLTHDHLLHLPPTLRAIDLYRSFGAYAAFRQVLALRPQSPFPVLEVLRIEEPGWWRVMRSTRVNWPSSLRALILSAEDELDLRELPTGLERLSAEVCTVLNAEEGFPSTITELKVDLTGDKKRLPIVSLPAGLKFLDLAQDSGDDIIDYNGWRIEELPKGLTYLRAPVDWTEQRMKALPTSLLCLDIPSEFLPEDMDSIASFAPSSTTITNSRPKSWDLSPNFEVIH